MTEWKARRFWKDVTVEPVTAGFTVRLDGRPVKTPGKAGLIVPTRALAQEIAAEWDGQDEAIDPRTMPFTRMANSAIEKVAPQRAEVAAMLAGYGDSDLLCYRADQPPNLVARQAEAWDPLLEWAADFLGARLIPVEGVMHHPQPQPSLKRLSDLVDEFDPFELTGLHDLVALSGSLIIGLAAARDHLDPEMLWQTSRIEENWQAEQWGEDEEAAEYAAAKRQDFLRAHRFIALLR